MKLSDFARVVKAKNIPNKNVEILGIEQKAQSVKKGFVFFVIQGITQNGADFIPLAIKNGAVALVTDQPIKASIPVIQVKNVRAALSAAAQIFYPDNLQKIAVTGTNGKGSTAFFVQQMMNLCGVPTASLGTLGVESPILNLKSCSTTPEPLLMHRVFNMLSKKKIKLIAIEASSHGLKQHRFDGVKFICGGFTNITHEHLDYHKTMRAYLNAKLLLFSKYVEKGGVAVINFDIPEFEKIKTVCEKRALKILTYGHKGADLMVKAQTQTPTGQHLVLNLLGKKFAVDFRVIGDFQVMNLLCALGLCLGAGADLEKLVAAIPMLKTQAGRMEPITNLPQGIQIYIDYAHTPDALFQVLNSLRPRTKGRLAVLFGCGGNRDAEKRAKMGKIACDLADIIYITDDNPRFEDPASIRAEIKSACSNGIEIAGRKKAILVAVKNLKPGDTLAICGKGHETEQIIGNKSHYFNDKAQVENVLNSFRYRF